MKCIIRQYGLGGGAPRSILQHIKVLKCFSYDDIECMTRNTDERLKIDFEEEVRQMIIRTSPAELCWERKYIRAFKEYLWEYKHIKQSNPNLVIVLGQLNGALYSDICQRLGIPLIIYIAGGPISQHDPCFDFWHDCEALCFSQENADMITRRFSAAHTNVVSNRISIQNRFDDIETHYMTHKNEVNVLIVSRLDSDKIKSIYSVISVLSKCATEDLSINIRIAGRGENQEDLRLFCDELQSNQLKIHMIGQVHDLTEQFRWAHVIAGKGRSVIEPIMMNRIGCIIGEDEKIEFCCKGNFENLYHYNFSGRKLNNPDSYKEMHDMLNKIKNGEIGRDYVLEIAEMTIQQYGASHLPDKLKQVLNKMPSSVFPKRVPYLYNYIRLAARYMLFDLIYRRK